MITVCTRCCERHEQWLTCEGTMGASDECDSLRRVDDWLTMGDVGPTHNTNAGVMPAFDGCLIEQGWPSSARELIAESWRRATGLTVGGGLITRGTGWRVWYLDGRVIDSTQRAWVDVPSDIVLGVAYWGTTRWMVQGRDPFWLTPDGQLHDSREFYPDGHRNPRCTVLSPVIDKMGVWISDRDMQHIRWLATLSFVL